MQQQADYKANGLITSEMRQTLRVSLANDHIEKMDGRDYLSYISVEHAVETANRIFKNWHYEITSEPKLNSIVGFSKVANCDITQMFYSCRVAVYLDGIKTFEDVGVDIIEEPKDGRIPGASDHETAYKGCIANGLKRALRGFGPQFGNSLYGKGNVWTEELLNTSLNYNVSELSDEMRAVLMTDIDPRFVSNDHGSQYLQGYLMIDQANRILGEGNWWYQITDDPVLHTLHVTDPATGEITATQLYYTAKAQLVVFGKKIFNEVGFSVVTQPGDGRTPDAHAHDSKLKGSATNALKRALRALGNQFGNGLRSGSESAGAGPACPKHGAGRNVRPSKFGDGLYCTSKDSTTESGYCDRTPIDPQTVPVTKETASYAARPETTSTPNTSDGRDGVERHWPYTSRDRSGSQPVATPAPAAPTPITPPTQAPAASGASPAADGLPSRDDLLEDYVRIRAGEGLNRGQVYTEFMRSYRKPISQATAEELALLVQSAAA